MPSDPVQSAEYVAQLEATVLTLENANEGLHRTVKRLRETLYRACVEVDAPEGVTLNHEDGTAHIDGGGGGG
jgi:hypothetical protein